MCADIWYLHVPTITRATADPHYLPTTFGEEAGVPQIRVKASGEALDNHRHIGPLEQPQHVSFVQRIYPAAVTKLRKHVYMIKNRQ